MRKITFVFGNGTVKTIEADNVDWMQINEAWQRYVSDPDSQPAFNLSYGNGGDMRIRSAAIDAIFAE